jgi:hypothetical protein
MRVCERNCRLQAGLALTRDDLVRHAQEEDACLFDGPDDEKLRIRSEEFEELIAGFLYAVGNIRSAHILHPVVAVMKRFRRDREARDLVSPVRPDRRNPGSGT